EHDGWVIHAAFRFADHYRYRRRDLDALVGAAEREPGSTILTTEKDAVRLLALRPLPAAIAAVPLTVRVEPAAAFQAWLGDRVRAALAGGKGVLMFSGHFGYWELQGIAHPLALPPMSVLARPLDNPYLQRLLEHTRKATGNGVIYRRGAVRRVLRALSANEIV